MLTVTDLANSNFHKGILLCLPQPLLFRELKVQKVHVDLRAPGEKRYKSSGFFFVLFFLDLDDLRRKTTVMALFAFRAVFK